MRIFGVIILAILLQNLVTIQTYEYCSREVKLCRNKRHIVCHKEQIQPDAEYQKHFPMTNRFRNWILYWHNYYRNEVACGKVKGSEGPLPTASQMRELAWDYELEYIAGIHAGRCRMEHDECRNTMRIRFSGQNLATHRTTGPASKALDRTEKMIFNWYKESGNVTEEIIRKYAKIPNVKIGHFTVLAKDEVGRIGCAMTFCKGFPNKAEWIYEFLTCNYDHTNIQGYPVYIIGDSASNCKFYDVGKSSNFTCLCAKSF